MNFKSFLIDASQNVVGAILNKVGVLVIGILFSRYSEQQDFANFGAILAALAAFQSITILGLSVTATRMSVLFRDNLKKLNENFILINAIYFLSCLIIFPVVCVFDEFIFTSIFNSNYILDNLYLFLFVVLIQGFCDLKLAYNIGLGDFKANLKYHIFYFISFVFFALLIINSGYYDFIICLWLFSSVIGFVFLKSGLVIESNIYNLNKKSILVLLSYSTPALISSIIISPVMFFVIGLYTKVDEDLSNVNLIVITVSNQILAVFSFIPILFSQVLISRINVKNGVDSTTVEKVSMYVFIISSSFAILFCFLSDFIVGLYSLENSVKYSLMVAVFTGVIVGYQSQYDSYIIGLGKIKYHMLFNLIFSICLVFIAFNFPKEAFYFNLCRMLSYILRLFVLRLFWCLPRFHKKDDNVELI